MCPPGLGERRICDIGQWKTREACLHAENYTLERKLETSLRSKEIKITDIIVNNSQYEQPLMLLYHINVGYPILDEGARFFPVKLGFYQILQKRRRILKAIGRQGFLFWE